MSALNIPQLVAPRRPRTRFSAEHEQDRQTARRCFETENSPRNEKGGVQQHLYRNL